ncbi:unnamed protein product [Effrenium voratum]|uniref:Uncharacterized protein n=1 Tax=Effrenium voratum TaxID=2562239 RepID=A0AA36J1L9_9DINO|nr:unnamed protein product [Effrenium voratum]
MLAEEAMIRSEWVVLGCYAAIYAVSVCLIIRSMTKSPPGFDNKLAAGHKVEDMDAETRVWRQGFLSWLAVSWATPWCARWGHSLNAALTKIKADQLPQLGFRDDMAHASADQFEKFWAEEVQAVGAEKANIANAIIKMWPRPKLMMGALAYGSQVLLGQLYSVYLVRISLMHFFKLQAWVNEHPYEERNMTNQILVAIFAFTLYPLFNIFIASVTNSINTQLDQRLCGGIAVALFRKAERLPSTSGTERSTPGASEGEPAKADLQTLLNHDVLTALIGSFESACLATSSLASLFVLFVMMATQLRLATLMAFGTAIPCLVGAVILGDQIGKCMLTLQERSDRRVVTLREVLFGVRVVKCYGWEIAMEQKLSELRKNEVEGLRTYWNCTCFLTSLLLLFPRLLIWAGLVGYAAIYGAHDVATIFTSLQILACLRGSCEILAQSLARVSAISPSLTRVQSFLKLPEAPAIQQGGGQPAWLQYWPVEGGDFIKVQGTYRWSSDPAVPPAIRNVQLQIPCGELVAIVGTVGSGKSALLQAILGELQPDESSEKAFISRPKTVAYCSQIPHIAEGTLKENVLLGQAFDQSRYEDSLRAASLGEDLKVLPGGDQVPVGARGISLSGGQKARVSMARAAYHMNSALVLMDDPFASVDAPTAGVIMEKLLEGPLMQGRTCVVTTQPDNERLAKFHKVVLMAEGKVFLQGTPEEIMASEAYQQLLSSKEGESFGQMEDAPAGKKMPLARKDAQTAESLREEEFEGRPSIALVKDYIQIGRYRHILTACLLLMVMIYFFLLCDLVIARWSNELSINPQASAKPYLSAYLFWLGASLVFWVMGWREGQAFTMRLSAAIHDRVIHRLLRAPVDRFFDKQPVGRIMSRLVGDMASVDLSLYAKTLLTVTIIYGTVVPLIYVHTMVPAFITVMALPLYYLIFTIYERYRNTSVPMRYCFASSKSDMNGLVTDVMSSTAAIRAYGDEGRLSEEMCLQVDKTLKVCMMSNNVLRRWLGNRVQYLWSFLTSTTYVAALLYPDKVGAGTLGVCMTNLLMMQNLIEGNIDSAIGSLFEIIALARIHEYVDVPQERNLTCKTDGAYRNFTVRLSRAAIGKLNWWKQGDIVRVYRGSGLLLQSSIDGKALLPAAAFDKEAAQLAELCPKSSKLKEAHTWHRLVGANDVIADAEQLALELCEGPGENVVLDVRSGWCADGAKLELLSVKAGYADIPRDVLKGITLTFQPRSTVGIVGTTGCGKSSLLLVLLRILEPRAGKVLLNGVDTSTLGLSTLRGALGLVPQDPLLFTGSLRHNLDPLDSYTDGRIWEALRCAHLDGLVHTFTGELNYQVSDEGSNLSFGQRQLFCLARMVLRQPSLLLLDEATSAIDPRTQENVQETISNAFPDSTLVAIAHRLETVLEFDQLVVLDQGEVAEQGTVKELQQIQDGKFRRMLAAKKVW